MVKYVFVRFVSPELFAFMLGQSEIEFAKGPKKKCILYFWLQIWFLKALMTLNDLIKAFKTFSTGLAYLLFEILEKIFK